MAQQTDADGSSEAAGGSDPNAGEHPRDEHGNRIVVTDDWSSDETHSLDYCRCDCGNKLVWPFPEGCDHYADEEDPHGLTFVCQCGFSVPNPTAAERACHRAGVPIARLNELLDAITRHSEHGEDAREYFAKRSWSPGNMDPLTVARETGHNPCESDIETMARDVADGLDTWCNEQGLSAAQL